LLGLGVFADPARAAPNGEPDAGSEVATESAEADEVSRDSPRASMAEFMALARAERWDLAAAFVDPPEGEDARAPELARRLKAVLDRKAAVDVGKLSALASGDTGDDLPRLTDELTQVEAENGRLEPVRIARRNRDGLRWMFTPTTVSRIDAWYEGLSDRFLLDNLPPALLRTGPKGLLRWQWLALPVLFALAFGVGLLLGRVGVTALAGVVRRTRPEYESRLAERLTRPVTLCLTLGVAYLLLPWLELYGRAETFVHGLMNVAFLVLLFWMLSRVVSVLAQGLARSPWAVRSQASRSLIPLGTRVTHVALWGLGLVAILSQLGYPVTSLIAGLGVGGLAVALAAQKTLENLFGAFAIGADQPFREGDTIQAEGFTGTVEAIGLRSTKLRTADRTLITIPNGKLADMRLETLAARDRLRFATTLSLAYGTTAEQVRRVIEGVECTLSAHPKLFPEGAAARLLQFGASSIDIEVAAYFATLDGGELAEIRESLLFAFMEVVEQAGTQLAAPTRIVKMA
jgi:MscS family membrane protein